MKRIADKLSGSYYTPYRTIQFMKEYLAREHKIYGKVLEPSVGDGRFLDAFEKEESIEKIVAVELIEEKVGQLKNRDYLERDMSNYDLYYMFDTDTKTVVYFGTNDTCIERGTYTGGFSTGVTITWSHGEWTEKFIHKSGNYATLIDGNGWDWEYKVCDVEKAQNVLDSLQ